MSARDRGAVSSVLEWVGGAKNMIGFTIMASVECF